LIHDYNYTLGLNHYTEKNIKNKLEKKQRIAKLISRSGFSSRRKAEELIFQGKVKV